jgi:hypothetical protein
MYISNSFLQRKWLQESKVYRATPLAEDLLYYSCLPTCQCLQRKSIGEHSGPAGQRPGYLLPAEVALTIRLRLVRMWRLVVLPFCSSRCSPSSHMGGAVVAVEWQLFLPMVLEPPRVCGRLDA